MDQRHPSPIGSAPTESWLVTRGEPIARSGTNRTGGDALLKHVLGCHAAVVPAPPDGAAPGVWTILALGVPSYDTYLAQWGVELRDRGMIPGLADYWRSDYAGRQLGGNTAFSAVHHVTPFEGITTFDAEAKRIVYACPATTPLFIPHLEHLVTHVMRVKGWADGFADVHAAFVRYRGKGVALIGPRRAGKTSLAMHLLSRGGAMLGSDMAQIRAGAGGGIEAVSIPHMCRITRETIWDNRWLAAAIGATCDDNDDYLRGPLFSHGKYELYDPSLDRIFQRPAAISAMRLDAILFPHFAVEAPRQEVAAMDPAEGKRRLMASIKTDRPLADWLPFDLSERSRAEAALERTLASAGSALQAYEFGFGREGSLDWGAIDGAFDRI